MGEGLLTPSKVTAWLDCAHYMTLRARVEAGVMEPPSQGMGAFARLVMEKGEQHETACLEDYRAQGRDVVEVAQRDRGETFSAWVARVGNVLTEGHAVLYQMPLIHGSMRGIADFLERVDLPNGQFTYEPVDAKLARAEAKPGHVLQLAFYADAIEEAVGVLPEHLHVWLGSGQREAVRTREVQAYWHRQRGRLFEALDGAMDAETEPEPCRHCDFCEFAAHCEKKWRSVDALHYVAGIRSNDCEALIADGTTTLAALAKTQAAAGMDEARFERLRLQAALQVQARELPEDAAPPFEQIDPGGESRGGDGHEMLPAPDEGDIFLDFEGHPFWRPDGGLFFLFGFITRDPAGDWVYTGRWAHDLDEERTVAEWLVDTIHDRLTRHPHAHVYHYNHTERSGLQSLFVRHGLDDLRLGSLVREGAFVDLLKVLRNVVQIGAESYSLKQAERLTDFSRRQDITKGAGAVIEYDEFMLRTPVDARSGRDHTNEASLARIAEYNEDDVHATRAVRDWLISIRPAGAQWREAQLDEAPVNEDVDTLVESLQELDTPDDHLVADLLGYWGREGRAHAAHLRTRAEAPIEEMLDDEEAIVGLSGARRVARLTPTGRPAKHPALELRFPQQPVADFSEAMYLTEGATPGYCTIHEVDRENSRVVIDLRTDGRERGDSPQSLLLNDWVDPSSKRPVLTDWAQEVTKAGGVEVLDDACAQLLTRRPTRFVSGGGPVTGEFSDDLTEMVRWAADLDRSWLAVQGPPGTGKTYRGARIIRHLVMEGKRVGITAMSHAAIHNLVEATHEAFVESGDLHRLAAAVKRNHPPPVDLAGVSYTSDNSTCAGDEFNVVAGTTWLFANSAMQASPVDVLVVDEAGQLALIDVIVAGGSAHNLVLLGDPQQLPQVDLATHPNGSGASALGHILGEAKTLQPHEGIFLPETRRMHPDVCDFISSQFYEGRVASHPSCATQTTHLGTGTRWIRARHTGCASRAPEEVELVTQEVGRVLSGSWINHEGEERQMTSNDVMVVTPYNDQKDALRAGLAGAGLSDVRVGTVDKFQGQEAPVVFFSAASSSAEDAPRGLGFVFSRNRFNVAISRARCLAYLVSTDAVLDATAETIDAMRTLSSVCAFAESAIEV